MVREGGIEPDSQVNRNDAEPGQKPYTTPINKSDTDRVNDTFGTQQIQYHNTSLHTKCAIDVQRDRVLSTFEQVPETLKKLVLIWDTLSNPAKSDVLRFVDQTLERRDVTQGDQDDQPDPIPPD